MSSRARLRPISISIVLALVFSAVLVTPALADGDAPPADEAVPVEDGGDVSDPAGSDGLAEPSDAVEPTVEPVPTDVAEPTAEPAPTETVVRMDPPDAPAEVTPTEPLAELPDGTTVAVVGEDGAMLPLASAEAAEILATGDPVWCPTGVLPGGAACSTGYMSLAALVASFVPSGSGVIWIEGGVDPSAGGVTISGSGNWAAAAAYALTLQGGWNGVGTTTIDTADPSVFNTNLSIIDWNAPVTLNDIVITGAPGPSLALEVETAGKVALTRVKVNSNGAGARIDNTSGTADVAVSKGEFSANASGNGLDVYSNGAITLADLVANGNNGIGARLDNSSAAAPKSVTMTSGALEASHNGGSGLEVYSIGSITLKDIEAIGNTFNGAYLDNAIFYPVGGITVNGTSYFDGNAYSGLEVHSTGDITIKEWDSVNNGQHGVLLVNGYVGGTGNVTAGTTRLYWCNSEVNNGWSGMEVVSNGTVTLFNICATDNGEYGLHVDNTSAPSEKAVTLANSSPTGSYNRFNTNGTLGLYIEANGPISIADVTAEGNTGSGASLNNLAAAAAGVTLAGVNVFAENGGTGIAIQSNGAVSGGKIVANANGYFGAQIFNTGAATALPVTLTGSSQFKFNGGVGLMLYSNGPITLSNLAVTNNLLDGADLSNAFPGFSSNVTLTGANVFNENYYTGLTITSFGAITLANVTADDNGLSDTDGLGAVLDNSSASAPKPITLTGKNEFGWNYGVGLVALSKGAIAVSSLTACGNGGSGARLNNTFSGASLPQKITLTVASTLNDNGGYGLLVYSHGAIAVANLTAARNGDYGAVLDNYRSGATTKPASVTLTGTNVFDDDILGGLDVRSLGAILVSNLKARWNGYTGAYLDNSWPGAVGVLTVSGTSEIADNAVGSGLVGLSRGNITLKDWDAYGNDAFGVYLQNAFGTSVGSVTAGTSRANWCNGLSDNGLSGMEVYSFGAVTLSNLCGGGNGSTAPNGYGLKIDNTGAATAKPVTLKGNAGLDGNYLGGVYILTKGAISANNLEANDNGPGFGAFLDNTFSGASAPQNVTLTGYGNYSGNAVTGLTIHSFGILTLSNVSASGNGGDGVLLDNYSGATTPKAMTIKGYIDAYENAGYGLNLHSLGAITLANLGADRNLYGARLNNGDGSAVGGVTITGGLYTSECGDYGLWVTSRGPIAFTLTDAWISANGGDGWLLDNTMAATPQPVSLSATTGNDIDFWDNGGDGLEILSKGLISISTLKSNSNTGFGAHLANTAVGAVGGITLTGPGANFGDNGGYGLLAESRGAITITSTDGLDAWGNGSWGAKLDNSSGVGGVTIGVGGVTGSSSDGNGGDGLIVLSKGAITLSDIETNGNGGVGTNLSNTASGPASPQNVTINKTAVYFWGANSFSGNQLTGLAVATYGSVTLTSISASDNGQSGTAGYGMSLDNFQGGTATSQKPVTLNGTNTFNGNYEGGLWVVGTGTAKANSLTASSNGGDGAWLWFRSGGTLTGTNTFEGNEGDGLWLWSFGDVTLNNLNASWNGENGAYLDVWGATTARKVTLTGTNTFLGNGDSVAHTGNGLEVWADGQISISNLTANWNAGSGVYLDNYDYWWVGTPSITLSGVNTFKGNYYDGLFFDSVGLVSLSNLTADSNGEDGVDGATDGNVLISCGSMTSNAGYGWYLWTPSVVTLKGVFAYGNGYNGFLDGGGTLVFYRSCP